MDCGPVPRLPGWIVANRRCGPPCHLWRSSAWITASTDMTSVLPTIGSEPARGPLLHVARHSGVGCHRPISIAHGQGACLHDDMIRKVLAILGSAVFLVIAPGFVAGLVPWWISRWRLEAPFFGMPLFRFADGMLITLGVIALLDSFVRFAVQGVGTPAPVFPTRHLVVTGLYRYVRNPMYVAMHSRSRLDSRNVTLLEYGGLVWLLFHLFVLVYEEPTLRASFGSEYKLFCTEVPRWIPRFTPWRGHPEA